MKYKVGDKVRLDSGIIVDIRKIGLTDEVYGGVANEKYGLYFLKSEILHLVISEITDELIDRFKNDKIAWHFKKKEDYEKTLDILYSKGVVYKSQRWLFNYNCIQYNFEQEWLERQNIGYYKKEEFEIIEIMNPVYVPFTDFTEEIEVNGIYKYDNCLKGNVKGKPVYKGIDCEVLYQHYINIQSLGKKNIDLWNEIQRLTKENDDLKRDKEKMLKDLDKMMFQLGRIAGIVDED